MTHSAKKTNRLANEKSPYLLQHAHNPVDWYPWGEEAFEKARREDKPVFLSIGYSTCHWCHVMERESFEDNEVAEALNGDFVSIKVDREERPDVDNIYMNACNMTTGSGGWPLSVFMDGDQKPFYIGTYFPKEGFLSVLSQIKALWRTHRRDIEEQAAKLAEAVSKDYIKSGSLDLELPRKCFRELSKRFDGEFGGFGRAPKFPTPHILMFLMRYSQTDGGALPMVTKTLDAYRNRGLFDQLGFGFFRYSTDRQFQIPHFEKMLYDNALLCRAYAEAYALTGEGRFARTARETISYLCGQLYNGEGGFYTAEDADSEGVEGEFYVFEKGEIESALGGEAEEFFEIFPVSARGNFEGKNHLYIADRALMDSKIERVNLWRTRLLEVRNRRPRPLRDEKILAAQNGMALAALAVSGRLLDDPGIIAQARKTGDFILNYLADAEGRLVSCVTDGKSGQPGFAEDYAFCVNGLLELYFATGEEEYYRYAVRLNESLLSDFLCPEGGFYHTGEGAEPLIARTRDIYDGAIPSANAVAVNNLLRLARLEGGERLYGIAAKAMESFMGTVSESPAAHCFSVSNLLLMTGGGADVVLSGKTARDTDRLRRAVPYFKCDVIKTVTGENADYPRQDSRAAAYVCAGRRCLPPVTGAEELSRLFEGL